LPGASTPGAAAGFAIFGIALVLDTMASYITSIGIADERWKLSAARNRRHRLLLLTTDVLALVIGR